MAIIFGVFAVGTGLGPVIGGLIVEHSTWRWVLWMRIRCDDESEYIGRRCWLPETFFHS